MIDRSSGNSYNRSILFHSENKSLWTYTDDKVFKDWIGTDELEISWDGVDRSVMTHYIMSLDNGTVTLYVNGDVFNTEDYTVEDNALENLKIGTDNSDYPPDFDIDQFRILNRSITDDEASKLYDEKSAKYSADISSNNLENAPTTAYFIEKNITIKTALTADAPTDDDFNADVLENWTIDDVADISS